MAINNSINAIPPTFSSVTMASAITSPVTITATSSVSLATTSVNTYLRNLIRNTSPDATETLLFNVSLGLTGVLTTGGNVQCWIETDQVTGIQPTLTAQYSIGTIAILTTAANFTTEIPILLSQIANAANTSFSVVIKNNTGVTLTLNSMSMSIPVTYVYAGLKTS